MDSTDARGWTAYHLACASGNAEATLALVTGGCRTQLLTALGEEGEARQSGWQLARRNDCRSVERVLEAIAKGKHGVAMRSLRALQLEHAILGPRARSGIRRHSQPFTRPSAKSSSKSKSRSKKSKKEKERGGALVTCGASRAGRRAISVLKATI